MRSVITYRETFIHSWPFVPERMRELWGGDAEMILVHQDDTRRLGEVIPHPETVDRLVSFGMTVTTSCLDDLSNAKEIGIERNVTEELIQHAERSGKRLCYHKSENYWGQSVSECALALTLCGLRRIPQWHHEIIQNHEPWSYKYRKGEDGSVVAGQFCDDLRFTNGTVEGKRVRLVGIGNIGSRYASFVHMLGADVAAWDPVASDPCFHRAGARKVHHLDELVEDAEILAPMMPLNDATQGTVKSEHIRALPKGCLVVLVTRAKICDVDAIRERVLADEIALAADVFDIEPLGADDPLLGRHNVVHTPHIAGRTMTANMRFAELLAAQFTGGAR